MRLLVVSQYFWPENFRINDLVAELVRRGHQVTLLTGLPNYPEGKVFQAFRDNPWQYAQYEGAEVIRVPMAPRGRGGVRLALNYLSYAVSASAIGLWKLRGRQFDAILAYEPSPITVGLPAALMRSVKRAPLAFWVLDLWPETLQAVGVVRSPVVLHAVGKLVAFIYKRCDAILAQSKSFIPQIQRYAGNKSRVVYFPNWAEAIFDMEHAEPAAEVPVQAGAFNVMFAGNIGDAQDFPAILAAAESLRDHTHIRWLIVGDGRSAGWVADEIKRRQLQDCVLMLGRHPVERMPSFFKHANALLVSLKDESIFALTIPGKLQSYLAAGIPVLAMLNGEGAEVVSASRSGLVCPAGDHAGLAAVVLKLSQMPEAERSAMGKRGLELTARDFDRGRLVTKLEEELQRLVLARQLQAGGEGMA
jgi:colanic acid biosynthesis glycosyl transferase WcaI